MDPNEYFDGRNTDIDELPEQPPRRKSPLVTVVVFAAAIIVIAAVLIFTGALGGGTGAAAAGADGLIINEVVSSNSLSLSDPVLGTPDWLELYNGGSADVELEGFMLNTSNNKQSAYTFPKMTIAAGEYLVVYCTAAGGGTDKPVAGFNIPKTGTSINLADASGRVISKLEVPALDTDVAWGAAQGGGYKYLLTPTPGAPNGEGIDSMADYDEGSTDLKITEVMPANESSVKDAEGRCFDWAELQNTGTTDIDLAGWKLSDDRQNPDKWKCPAQRIIKPGEYVIIYLAGKDAPAEGGDALYASFALSAEECSLVLASPRGTVIDTLSWDAAISANISVGRDDAGSTIYYTNATPGAKNEGSYQKTPAFAEAEDGSLVISEILRNNNWSRRDADGDRPAWAELHNISSSPVRLSDYALSDDSRDMTKWILPDIELEPDGYAVIFLSGKDRREAEYHTSFTLSGSDTELVLANIMAMTAQVVTLPTDEADNVSWGRTEDGAWAYFGQPTPGKPNSTASFAQLGAVERVDKNGVYISEVCAVNAVRSGKSDWIELYNGADAEVDISGWLLSDSKGRPDKWTIPEGTRIAAKSYIALDMGEGGKSSSPFSISAGGENILLCDAQGNGIDMMPSGSLRAGLTSGRARDDYSGTRVYFDSPTKGMANDPPVAQCYTAEPVLSAQTGFYDAGFTLTVSAGEGAAIHYTTDGSEPTGDSPLFTGSLDISDTTIFRCIATEPGKLKSDPVTGSYIFDRTHDIPVVLLCGSKSDISTVYASTTRANSPERKVYFAYLEKDGAVGVEFPAGIRVSGNSTRTYAQKSLNVYLRGGYGRSRVTYPFFGEYEHALTYSALTLRNSGQDTNVCKLRDAYAGRIALSMNVDASATQFVAVYINGEYWGLYDLKENQNENYLVTHYGSNEDECNVIRRNEKQLAGDNSGFLEARSFARSKDISNDENLKLLCEKVDAIGFIDYIIAQNIFCNTDMYNQKYWSCSDGTVRWRPILYDLDFAFRAGSGSRNMTGSYFTVGGVPSPEGTKSNMDIPCGLKENDKWVDEFLRRLAWYTKNTLSDETLLAVFDDMKQEMESEVSRHKSKWGGLSGWSSAMNSMRNAISGRAETVLSQFTRYFGKTDSYVEELLERGQDEFWREIESGYTARKDITVE